MRTDPTLNDSHKENLDIINRSGAHLLGLINDVLEISRIEASQVTRNETDFDLWESLETIKEMMRSRANAKGLRLILERDPALPRYVRADERKLKQVIINLAGNAVKFTQDGSVTLRAGTEEQGRALHFEVEDTGPGLEDEAISRLFQPFAQGGHGKEGAGLGLFISQRLVEVMGGRIAVQSERGKGSLFSFDIPCESVKRPETPRLVTRRVASLAAGQPRPCVLVAEDTQESRVLLVRLLQSVGFDVIEAANGLEAVRLFEERQPDLVLMDIRMPVMDGYEAIWMIRSTPQGTTPIIAVTASAFDEERQRILTIGANDVVSKPVQTDELFEKIRLVLGVAYTYVEEPAGEPEPVDEPDPKMMLANLSVDLLGQLTSSLALLNLDAFKELIPQVAQSAPILAKKLKELADGYMLTELTKLFSEVQDGAGPSPNPSP
jgi:CheY-like chemotaxis protein/anti-sigma regulatory factor (Ser/Thr protein kinase)